MVAARRPAYLDVPGPIGMAHRGFSLEGLENSLTAFRAAADLGFTYLETDINTTADGVTLVFHDASLDRSTDRSGLIRQMLYADVAPARIGGTEPIATLREFVTALPTARFNIDVKDTGSIAPLAALIEELGLHERVCVASFSDKRRRAVLARLSRPVTSSAGQGLMVAYVLLGSWLPDRLLRALLHDVDVLQIPRAHRGVDLVTPRRVARAHRLGLAVHVWTINDPAEMHELLDRGVDAIISDRADLLREVLRERGDWRGA